MTQIALSQMLLYLAIILILVKPLGWYMAQVYEDKPCGLNKLLNPIESILLRWCGIAPDQAMNWKQYLGTMLLFNLFGFLAVYAIQRLQFYLPLNPQAFVAVPPDLAFNTAASFVTNTNWQAYVGEAVMSNLTQTMAFTVQNFLSAATAMSLLVAMIRGIVRHETTNLGNFWIDTIRGTLYILLPLSLVFAVSLVSQGVIQNYKPNLEINLLDPANAKQIIPMGPVASQIAIKQLGSNGGGFFGANSAHPFENPTPLSNLLELFAIVLIPAALCYTFGVMANDCRQGWSVLIAMLLIFIICVYAAIYFELQPNPNFAGLGIEQSASMEGKETRFGVINSVLWSTATTAVSNGSVNAMLDSLNPLTGCISLFLLHLGEIIFGGVGSGLYGMLMLVIITVFVAGLMVGRTPEYLGKKIEPFEMKMAVVGVLVMPLIVLACTAIGVVSKPAVNALGNPGPHGFSEILYAFSSMGANNGSAFAGLNANNMFFNFLGGLVMLFTRYWTAIAAVAIAGSLVRKKMIPSSSGTLATHTPLFVMLLMGVIIILGALSFLPSLALGPIVEHLILWGPHGY